LDNKKLFWFMASSCYKNKILDDIFPYIFLKDGIHFGVLMIKIKHFKVIISTYVSALFAEGIGLPCSHFTHIFINNMVRPLNPRP
jgi:helicase MOV-10